jgi:hypothetical protein
MGPTPSICPSFSWGRAGKRAEPSPPPISNISKAANSSPESAFSVLSLVEFLLCQLLIGCFLFQALKSLLKTSAHILYKITSLSLLSLKKYASRETILSNDLKYAKKMFSTIRIYTEKTFYFYFF